MLHFSFLPCLLLLLNFLPTNASSKADKSEKILISGYASIHTIRHDQPGQLPDMNLPCMVPSSPTGSRDENHKSPMRERSCPSPVPMESLLAWENHNLLKRKPESSLPVGGYSTATTSSSFPSFGSTSKSCWAPSASRANNSKIERHYNQIKYTKPYLDNYYPSFRPTSNSYWAPSASRANNSKIERHNNQIKYTNPYLDDTYPSFRSTSNSCWARSASRENNSKVEKHNNQIKYTKPFLDDTYPSFRSTSNSYWARSASRENKSKVDKHNDQIKYTQPYLDQLEKQHSLPSFDLSNYYRAQNVSRTINNKVERHNEQIKYTKPYHDQLEEKRSSPSFGSASNSERIGIEETSGRQELDLTLRL
ncbi:hypothetical protein FRX31_013741 [Thalictrum thalictroides]|uniref:Uncharacterized protein n=1 Tax=Thalictrum thalictroides TaxID=46969 RepID=A0A7J6WI89_THATH|nr:hypothetical protein FRX31_013741 [Thalictrum thalictroides]